MRWRNWMTSRVHWCRNWWRRLIRCSAYNVVMLYNESSGYSVYFIIISNCNYFTIIRNNFINFVMIVLIINSCYKIPLLYANTEIWLDEITVSLYSLGEAACSRGGVSWYREKEGGHLLREQSSTAQHEPQTGMCMASCCVNNAASRGVCKG